MYVQCASSILSELLGMDIMATQLKTMNHLPDSLESKQVTDTLGTAHHLNTNDRSINESGDGIGRWGFQF